MSTLTFLHRGRHRPPLHLLPRAAHRRATPLPEVGHTAAVVATRVVLAALIATAAVLAYGLIDNRWYKVLAVDGASMAPTIHAGDAIVITRPPDVLRPGMILTLQVENRLVTHRLVGVEPDGTLVTRGDANDAADDWSGLSVHVVGRYRLQVPFVGRLLGLLRGTGGFLAERVSVPFDLSAATG